MRGLPCREESPCLHRPESGSALLAGSRVCAGGGGRAEQSVWGVLWGAASRAHPSSGAGVGFRSPPVSWGKWGWWD